MMAKFNVSNLLYKRQFRYLAGVSPDIFKQMAHRPRPAWGTAFAAQEPFRTPLWSRRSGRSSSGDADLVSLPQHTGFSGVALCRQRLSRLSGRSSRPLQNHATFATGVLNRK